MAQPFHEPQSSKVLPTVNAFWGDNQLGRRLRRCMTLSQW